MLSIKKLLAKLLSEPRIIETGTKDVTRSGKTYTWSYRKYSDGTVECWYRGDVGRVSLNTTLGTDKVSDYFNIPFPFTFAQIPSCVVGYEGNSTGYAWLEMGSTNPTTVDHSYGVRLARIGAANVALENNILTCHVVGIWK